MICPCPHFSCPDIMPFQGTTSWHGILLNTLQASTCMLPTLCIHATQATRHKDIWVPSTLNDLLMSGPALFKCNLAGAHAFSTTTILRLPMLIESWETCMQLSSCFHVVRFPRLLSFHIAICHTSPTTAVCSTAPTTWIAVKVSLEWN